MTNERTGTIGGNGLRAAARTDCGRQRDTNEDRYYLDLDAGVMLVVDGVGGHAAGEVAARIAEETIQKRLDRQDAAATVRIREAITLANQQILLQAEQSPDRSGMACVLTLAVLEGRRLTVGHVGDTRLYRFSPEGIAKMTHDHSPIGEREDAGEITETEAMRHARRNEVYRDVGSEPRDPDTLDFIETLTMTIEDDAALLLCSDGLSDMLSSAEINRLVRANAGDPARVADALVDAANAAGGKDNITVIYVEAPRFARAAAGGTRVLPPPQQQVATEALTGLDAPAATNVDAPVAPAKQAAPAAAPPAPRKGWVLRVLIALLAGSAIGLGAAILLTMRGIPLPWTPEAPHAPRELIVGGSPAAPFLTIADALRDARDGDVIRVKPGRYEEALEIRRNITLISDEPHGAILAVPAGEKTWASITIWAGRSELRGFRIVSNTPAAHVGVRTHGGEVEIDDAMFEGALEIGLDAVGGRASVRGSQFTNITGLPVQGADGAVVALRNNRFRAPSGATGPAVSVRSAEGLTLDGNLFVHYRTPVAAATGPAIVIDPIYVVSPPAPRRGRGR